MDNLIKEQWEPDSETMLVLQQAGYSQEILNQALGRYQNYCTNMPEYYEKTDKDFVLFLRSTWIDQSLAVENKINDLKTWRPTARENEKLHELGYWPELIENQLSFFVEQGNHNGRVIISKFALFKSFIRHRVPVNNITLENWYPSKALIATIYTELLVYEDTFIYFFDIFLQLAEEKSVPGHLVPRFFYSFIKKNQTKILQMAAARVQL